MAGAYNEIHDSRGILVGLILKPRYRRLLMAKAKMAKKKKARTVREGGGPGIETILLRVVVAIIVIIAVGAGVAFCAVPRVMM